MGLFGNKKASAPAYPTVRTVKVTKPVQVPVPAPQPVHVPYTQTVQVPVPVRANPVYIPTPSPAQLTPIVVHPPIESRSVERLAYHEPQVVTSSISRADLEPHPTVYRETRIRGPVRKVPAAEVIIEEEPVQQHVTVVEAPAVAPVETVQSAYVGQAPSVDRVSSAGKYQGMEVSHAGGNVWSAVVREEPTYIEGAKATYKTSVPAPAPVSVSVPMPTTATYAPTTLPAYAHTAFPTLAMAPPMTFGAPISAISGPMTMGAPMTMGPVTTAGYVAPPTFAPSYRGYAPTSSPTTSVPFHGVRTSHTGEFKVPDGVKAEIFEEVLF